MHGICRIGKIKTAGDLRGHQIHNNREKDSYSNPDINKNRTHNNYNLLPSNDKSYIERINELRAKNNCKTLRKDAVIAIGGIYTASPEFFADKTDDYIKEYFLNCLSHAENFYGADNIISATVHMDEATPHLHIISACVTPNGGYSARHYIGGNGKEGRQKLQNMQDSFFADVCEPRGLKRGNRVDVNGDNATRKHKSTRDYKREKAEEKAQSEIEKLQAQLALLKQENIEETKDNDLDLDELLERAMAHSENKLTFFDRHNRDFGNTLKYKPININPLF